MRNALITVVRYDHQKKIILAGLGMVCVATWVLTAIHPLDRQAWFLENILVAASVLVLLVSYRRLQFSTASWVCLSAFLILHIIGAHCTCAPMPVGLWAKEFFHLSRNDYDRFAHAAFGFLLVFPVRELIERFSGVRHGTWSFWLPAGVILATSGFFEILESIVAEIVAPGQGVTGSGSRRPVGCAE